MNVIVDTGPLVALLDRSDPLHAWAVRVLTPLPTPWLVCEAVLTEASHFVGESRALRDAWRAGELAVAFEAQAHRDRVVSLLEKYAPMDFADACVVAMAELHDPSVVVTIDRKDFARYRIFGRRQIRAIMP
ncbi:MAG: PIN domain-containing protein [Sandaracinaceae bacterium]|nr:PIN domain-containing protein [Sandaracinaceae bacterium]